MPTRGPPTPQPHQQHLPGQHPEPGGLSGGCGPRASARARGTQHRGGRGAEDGPRGDRTGQLRPGRQRLGLRTLGVSAACGRLFRWLPGSQRDLSRGHRSFMPSFHLYEACHSDRWPSRPSADAPRPLWGWTPLILNPRAGHGPGAVQSEIVRAQAAGTEPCPSGHCAGHLGTWAGLSSRQDTPRAGGAWLRGLGRGCPRGLGAPSPEHGRNTGQAEVESSVLSCELKAVLVTGPRGGSHTGGREDPRAALGQGPLRSGRPAGTGSPVPGHGHRRAESRGGETGTQRNLAKV